MPKKLRWRPSLFRGVSLYASILLDEGYCIERATRTSDVRTVFGD